MKWIKSVLFIVKSLTTILILYLLLTKFNDRGFTEITQIITYQILYPFPVLPNETVDFVRIIMALGFSFISFLMTYLLMSNFADGGKELVRFHSKNEADFHYKISKIIFSHFLIEFLFQVIVIASLMLTIPTLTVEPFRLSSLFITWLIIDCICFLLIQIYSLSSVMIIILLILENLARYLLMKQILGFIILFILLLLFHYFRKEKTHVEN